MEFKGRGIQLSRLCARAQCFSGRRISRSASQPANFANVSGRVRVCPHLQLMVETYCPKWSPSFTTLTGGRGGIMDLET
jgi:hypothetical protein